MLLAKHINYPILCLIACIKYPITNNKLINYDWLSIKDETICPTVSALDSDIFIKFILQQSEVKVTYPATTKSALKR